MTLASEIAALGVLIDGLEKALASAEQTARNADAPSRDYGKRLKRAREKGAA